MDPLELSLRLPGSPPPAEPTDVAEMNDVDDAGHVGSEYVPDGDDDTDDDDEDDDDNENDDDAEDEDDDDEDDDGDNGDVISSSAASQQAGSSQGEQRRSSMEDYLDRVFNIDNRYRNQRRTVLEQPPVRNMNQRRTVREQPPVIDRHLNMEGTNGSMASSSRGEQRMISMEDYLDRMFNVDNTYLNQRRTVREQPPLSNLNQRRTVREQPPLINCHLNMEGTNTSMSEPVSQSAPPLRAMSIFKCPICMDPLVEETVTKCGHIFCGPCIRAAIAAKHNLCPLCRCNITLCGLIRIYMPNSN